MNILIVSLFPLERNTSVANSSISIIKGLMMLGHSVSIAMPEWPINETGYSISSLRIIRIYGKIDTSSRKWLSRKIHSHFDFLDSTRVYLKNIRQVEVPNEYFDIVLSFSDPKTTHVFTARLLKYKNVKYGRWIQHWGDPIFGDITRNFWWPDWVVKYYERRIIQKADKSVYVTPFTLGLLQDIYPELKSCLSFVPLPAEMLPDRYNNPSKELRLSYLGDYNPSIRNLMPLYMACSKLENVKLTIAGHGPMYPECENIKIMPRISQIRSKIIEDDSDVLVCVCNKSGTQIPGKIMYKTSTSKHILVAVERDRCEEMKGYLESFQRFIICDNTEESITKSIVAIFELKKEYHVPDRLLPVNVASEILQ